MELDLDITVTEAALDRLLENGVVLRDEGADMKHLTMRENVQETQEDRCVGREYRWEEFWEDLFILEIQTALDGVSRFAMTSFTRLLSWMT